MIPIDTTPLVAILSVAAALIITLRIIDTVIDRIAVERGRRLTTEIARIADVASTSAEPVLGKES